MSRPWSGQLGTSGWRSSYVSDVLQPVTHLPFVNADVIAAERWPNTEAEHAYAASQAAEAERQRLMTNGVSFSTETVFSNPSEVDLIHHAVALGYLVHPPVINSGYCPYYFGAAPRTGRGAGTEGVRRCPRSA